MATVDRVLPWRRQAAGSGPLEPVLAALRERTSRGDLELVRRAYQAAEQAHEGQFRQSGEPYISHPLAVATVVAELGLDHVSVAAALLHDAVEDTGMTLEHLE